jgi:hypothetical protein
MALIIKVRVPRDLFQKVPFTNLFPSGSGLCVCINSTVIKKISADKKLLCFSPVLLLCCYRLWSKRKSVKIFRNEKRSELAAVL